MSSVYADQGTAAHKVLEECLTNIHTFGLEDRASNYVGRAIEIVDEEHAVLSPSSAERWMTCPGSVAFIAERIKSEKPGAPRKVVFTEDDAVAVQTCLEYVMARKQALLHEYDLVTLYTERKVNPAVFIGTDECVGTSDITLVCDKFVEHIDYKHGAGVLVDESGPQNKLYLLGTCAEHLGKDEIPGEIPFRKARRTIVQPRCEKIDSRIRWVEVEDLSKWALEFATEVRQAIRKIHEPEPELHASEKACRFCPAKGACQEHIRFAMASAGLVDPAEPLPTGPNTLYDIAEDFAARDTRSLSDIQLRQILDAREILTGALQAVEAYAQQLLINGEAPPAVAEAYKLVHTRTRRRWNVDDQEDLIKRLKSLRILDPETQKRRSLKKNELYQETLRSVAQIEKVFKTFGLGKTAWEAFRLLVDKPEGGLVIAPMSDPRAPVETEVTAEEAFTDTPILEKLPFSPIPRQEDLR